MKNTTFADKYQKTNPITRALIDNFYRAVGRLAAQTKGVHSVLEVACGPGFSTRYLSGIFAGAAMNASDVDPALVADARTRNPSVQFGTESIYALNREDNSVDLVCALEVLEHLEDPEAALREIRRVTRKYCIVSVPREPLWRALNFSRGYYLTDWGNTPGHINHWSKRGITELVGKHFEILDSASPLPWTILLARKHE